MREIKQTFDDRDRAKQTPSLGCRLDTSHSQVESLRIGCESGMHQDRDTSHKDLMAILDDTNDIICFADRYGRITYLNRSGREFFHLQQMAACRETIDVLYPPWARKILRKDGLPTAVRKDSWYGASAILCASEQEIPISQWIRAHRFRNGEVKFFSFTMHVLDDQSSGRISLRAKELFPVYTQPQWIYDLDTSRIIAVNSAAITQYGYTEHEFLSMTVDDLLLPDDATYFHQMAMLSAETRINKSGIRGYLKKDDTIVTLEVFPGPAIFAGHGCRSVLVFDVSQQKKGEMGEAEKRVPQELIRVIVVEDDDSLRALIEYTLSAAGLDVVGVADGTGFYKQLLRSPADIVVLDLGLPGEDGFAILKHVRSLPSTRTMGVIVLSGYGAAQMRVKCLESGADVFLTKPVEMSELLAQITSLYRRLQMPVSPTAMARWRLCRKEGKLIAPSGTEITLTHLETAFIQMIASAAGQPVKRKDIITTAFSGDPLTYDMRRLEALVSRLRKKIHKRYPLSQPIKAAHAVGYMFTDRIEMVD